MFDLPPQQEEVKNPFAKWEDQADETVPTATLQIYNYIDKVRQAKPIRTHVARASNATICPKRRQYQKEGLVGIPLTPRKMINFHLGHMAEIQVLHWIKMACVGPGKLYKEVFFGDEVSRVQIGEMDFAIYDQRDLTWDIKDDKTGKTVTVTAHADGLGVRNIDDKVELIECKTASNYGFAGFKEKGADDYLRQSHALMETGDLKTMGVDSVRFFYLRKETGHLWDRLHYKDPKITEQVRSEFLAVEREEIVESPFKLVPCTKRVQRNKAKHTMGIPGKMKATFPCTYCPYLELCHGKHTVEWNNGQHGVKRPEYIFDKEWKQEDYDFYTE